MNSRSLIILIVAMVSLFLFNELYLNKDVAGGVSVTSSESTGEAAIGGAFELTDQNGNKFTQAQLKDKYSLVFFGFTHCPMVCPTTLSSLTLAMQEMGEGAKNKFQIIFITVDPERDDAARMKEYLSTYGFPITGLTGTKEQIESVKNEYKVYAQKSSDTQGKDYNMDHSTIVYLMDKDGKYSSHFSSETKLSDIVGKLKPLR